MTRTRINDGGPAFPLNPYINPRGVVIHEGTGGMTLRDWFAGQALAGFTSGFTGAVGDTEWFRQVGAPAAYAVADAMLAAREVKP